MNLAFSQKWKTRRDTLPGNMIVEFCYPPKFEILHSDSAILIGDPAPVDFYAFGNFVPFWSIDRYLNANDSSFIESIVDLYKSSFNQGCDIKSEKQYIYLTNLENIPCIKYDIYNLHPRNRATEIIFFFYKNNLFILWGDNRRDFKKFYESLKIIKNDVP